MLLIVRSALRMQDKIVYIHVEFEDSKANLNRKKNMDNFPIYAFMGSIVMKNVVHRGNKDACYRSFLYRFEFEMGKFLHE